jgi:hypothetical protein
MGGFSIWHILILLIIGLLWAIPIAKLFERVGYSPWWAVFGFIPIVGVALVWVLAFSPWRIADADAEPLVGDRT